MYMINKRGKDIITTRKMGVPDLHLLKLSPSKYVITMFRLCIDV